MVTVMVPLVTVSALVVLPLTSLAEKVSALATVTVAGDPRVAFAVMTTEQVLLSVWVIEVSAPPVTTKSSPAEVDSVLQSIGSLPVTVKVTSLTAEVAELRFKVKVGAAVSIARVTDVAARLLLPEASVNAFAAMAKVTEPV
jgi:hypothetical protein